MADGMPRQDIFARMLDMALRTPELDCGGIYTLDTDSGGFRLVASQGLSDNFIEAVHAYPEDSAQAKIVHAGQTICSCTEKNEGCNNPEFIHNEELRAEGIHCLMVLPIVLAGKAIACINLGGKRAHRISQNTSVATQALAYLFGQTLARLEAQEEAQRQQENLGGLFNTLRDFFFVLDLQRQHPAPQQCRQRHSRLRAASPDRPADCYGPPAGKP